VDLPDAGAMEAGFVGVRVVGRDVRAQAPHDVEVAAADVAGADRSQALPVDSAVGPEGRVGRALKTAVALVGPLGPPVAVPDVGPLGDAAVFGRDPAQRGDSDPEREFRHGLAPEPLGLVEVSRHARRLERGVGLLVGRVPAVHHRRLVET
jgi:hypothetical protein